MKKKFIFILLMFFSYSLVGQTILGRVTGGPRKDTIIGAVVQLCHNVNCSSVGNNNATVTDINGFLNLAGKILPLNI